MIAADRRRLTPVLGIVAGLLVLLLVALWLGLGRTPRWRDDATPAKVPAAGASLPAPSVPPLARFSAVWLHPLFSPTRTPAPVGNNDGGSSGDLQLTGVIMLPGLNMAILHDRATGRDYRVIEGTPTKAGPRLLALEPRRATVESGGTQLQLRLVPGPSPTAASKAPDVDADASPEASANDGASGIVVRRGNKESQSAGMSGTGQASVEARARALKARIEARRRQAQQDGDGG